jgi:hypothetical protein
LLSAVIVVLLAAPQLAGAQNASLNQSFGATSAGSTAESVRGSQVSSTVTLVVLGAGLLAGVGGGISTTMFRKNDPARARRKQGLPPEPPEEPLPYPGAPATGPETAPPSLPPPPPPPPPPVSSAGPSIDAMVLARAWLLANEVQLKQDLALGAGPSIDDLAGIAGIAPSHRAHFGRVLQRHRARLLTPHEVTPQQAAELMSRIGELVLADPLLRAEGEAVLAAM